MGFMEIREPENDVRLMKMREPEIEEASYTLGSVR